MLVSAGYSGLLAAGVTGAVRWLAGRDLHRLDQPSARPASSRCCARCSRVAVTGAVQQPAAGRRRPDADATRPRQSRERAATPLESWACRPAAAWTSARARPAFRGAGGWPGQVPRGQCARRASCSPASAYGACVDEGSFVEDGVFAERLAGDLPADGVVTGSATVDGRPVCVMANDSTVKAGSWGARTVEKIIRIIETAYRDAACRWSTSSTRPAPGSPTRSTCSPAGAAPGRSSGTRSGPAGRSRRCARCSGRPLLAAPTSRRSATSWSWSRATRRCTSASDRMVEMVTGRRRRSRRWAARGCTARSPASVTSW